MVSSRYSADSYVSVCYDLDNERDREIEWKRERLKTARDEQQI
jgi:hypothetical protein